jgi:hypothetical protein
MLRPCGAHDGQGPYDSAVPAGYSGAPLACLHRARHATGPLQLTLSVIVNSRLPSRSSRSPGVLVQGLPSTVHCRTGADRHVDSPKSVALTHTGIAPGRAGMACNRPRLRAALASPARRGAWGRCFALPYTPHAAHVHERLVPAGAVRQHDLRSARRRRPHGHWPRGRRRGHLGGRQRDHGRRRHCRVGGGGRAGRPVRRGLGARGRAAWRRRRRGQRGLRHGRRGGQRGGGGGGGAQLQHLALRGGTQEACACMHGRVAGACARGQLSLRKAGPRTCAARVKGGSGSGSGGSGSGTRGLHRCPQPHLCRCLGVVQEHERPLELARLGLCGCAQATPTQYQWPGPTREWMLWNEHMGLAQVEHWQSALCPLRLTQGQDPVLLCAQGLCRVSRRRWTISTAADVT